MSTKAFRDTVFTCAAKISTNKRRTSCRAGSRWRACLKAKARWVVRKALASDPRKRAALVRVP